MVGPPRAKKQKREPRPPARKATSLTELPDEVLAVIASFLTPVSLIDGSGLVSPLDFGYKSRFHAITANHAFRRERFGAVPASWADVISFSRSCRRAMNVCFQTVGGVGASRSKDDQAKGFPVLRSCKKRQLYIRLEHAESTADNLLKMMLDNRSDLEEVVIHSCGNHDLNKTRLAVHETGDPSTFLSRACPLQELAGKDTVPLPRLKRLQLGPDVCISCMRTATRIFTAKVFEKGSQNHRTEGHDWHLGIAYPSIHNQTYAHHPAPGLSSIQYILPDMFASARLTEVERLRRLLAPIDRVVAEKITTFSMVLRGQLDRNWGGFGVGGGTTRVNAKTCKQADIDLTELAKQKMTPAGTSYWRKQKEEREQLAITKYNTTAKSLTKPAPKMEEDDPIRRIALAAVSSIGNGKEKATIKQEPKERHHQEERDEEDILTPADRQSIHNHARMEEQYSQILAEVAGRFPNLKALQVVRGGVCRTDVVEPLAMSNPDAEQEATLARMSNVLVAPITRLTQLQHLDLGLAMLGRREVCDFPIGLSAPAVNPAESVKAKGPTHTRLLMLRHRLHQESVARAMLEGDAWRNKAITRYALGSQPDSPKWPAGIKSGFVYSPDILDRSKYRGLLTCWEKDVLNGEVVLKWTTRHSVQL